MGERVGESVHNIYRKVKKKEKKRAAGSAGRAETEIERRV
jgi:hypothetical protein